MTINEATQLIEEGAVSMQLAGRTPHRGHTDYLRRHSPHRWNYGSPVRVGQARRGIQITRAPVTPACSFSAGISCSDGRAQCFLGTDCP
jgi:hypothetical protein